MERRVLIVESQNDFALSMATVLKSAGYHTAMAATSADAQRELEKRRPDLVVVRAELPDQSGFTLCGQIKKGKWGQNLKVLLLSSDTGVEGLNQHRHTQGAADGYLVIPFEMGELASMSAGIVPPGTEESDDDLDAALSGNASREAPPPMPPPLRTSAGGPPKLPKRERRSAITDEDRAFMDRAFQSIADRKAELLAESRQLKRPPPRRELMGTPEGKIQILRDELKGREAQLARLSEIWSVRERELLSVEDRLHEKDVELQGLKMQVDDLLRRFNEAQQAIVQKEREHGATVDDLLLQKFGSEKDLIEVVASKEKDINVLRKEVHNRDDELSRRAAEIDRVNGEYDKLEKHLGIVTLEFEVKEQKLQETVRGHEAEIAATAWSPSWAAPSASGTSATPS
jgi:CheY-like chemotaxis protein